MPADLNPRFVDGNVQEGADDVHVGFQADIQSRCGQPSRGKESVQLLGPLRHQQVDVRHLLGVLDGGGRLGPVQVVNVFDPFLDDFVVLSLAEVDDFLHLRGPAAGSLAQGPQLELHDVRVGLPGRRLVQHRQPQLQRVVGLHLDEGVNVADSRDKLGDERLQLGVELQFLRNITEDVVKQIPDILAHWQVGELLCIIHSLNRLRGDLIIILIIIIVIVVFLLRLMFHLDIRVEPLQTIVVVVVVESPRSGRGHSVHPVKQTVLRCLQMFKQLPLPLLLLLGSGVHRHGLLRVKEWSRLVGLWFLFEEIHFVADYCCSGRLSHTAGGGQPAERQEFIDFLSFNI